MSEMPVLGAEGSDVPAGAEDYPPARLCRPVSAWLSTSPRSAISRCEPRPRRCSSTTVAPAVVANAMRQPRRRAQQSEPSTPSWRPSRIRRSRFRLPPNYPASGRGGPTRSRSGSRTGRSTTSRSAAASPRSIPRCESSGAHSPPTTSCARSTGAMTTDHARRCASSTASWARRTWSMVCSSRCRGITGRATTYCCTPCRFTAAGPKSSRLSAVSATSPSGLGGFAESMAQAVHDFRSIVDYLRHTGVQRVALTGISLGGYTSALLASVEDRLEAVIPNCPVVTPGEIVRRMVPGQRNWSGWAFGWPTSTATSSTAGIVLPLPTELCAGRSPRTAG